MSNVTSIFAFMSFSIILILILDLALGLLAMLSGYKTRFRNAMYTQVDRERFSRSGSLISCYACLPRRHYPRGRRSWIWHVNAYRLYRTTSKFGTTETEFEVLCAFVILIDTSPNPFQYAIAGMGHIVGKL